MRGQDAEIMMVYALLAAVIIRMGTVVSNIMVIGALPLQAIVLTDAHILSMQRTVLFVRQDIMIVQAMLLLTVRIDVETIMMIHAHQTV